VHSPALGVNKKLRENENGIKTKIAITMEKVSLTHSFHPLCTAIKFSAFLVNLNPHTQSFLFYFSSLMETFIFVGV